MKGFQTMLAASMAVLVLCTPGRSEIVINEVFYNSPNDLGDLEYVELFNTGDKPVDLSGWELSKGIELVFPEESVIEPKGFVVVCKDEKLFAQFYQDVPVAGVYEKSLGNGSDTIALKDSSGEEVDSVSYDDEAPWPVSADGYSASLERICPVSPGDTPDNWGPSLLSDDYDRKPSGTPGQVNSVYQATLPPVIEKVGASVEEVCAPGTVIDVRATVRGTEKVTLLYRVVQPGGEGEEASLEMKRDNGGRFAASIPSQEANRIVRFRVQATGEDGAVRFSPHQNEIRPAISVYVSGPVKPAGIPVAHFFNVGEEEARRGAEYLERASSPGRGPGGFGRPGGRGGRGGFQRPPETAEDRARREAERIRRDAELLLRDDSLESAWGTLTLESGLTVAQRGEIVPAFRAASASLAGLRDELNSAEDIQNAADSVPDRLAQVGDTLRQECASVLGEEQRKVLDGVGVVRGDDRDRGRPGGPGGRGFEGGSMLQRMFNVERTWFQVSMNQDVGIDTLAKVHGTMVKAIVQRDRTEIDAGEGERPDFRAIMETVEEQREALNKALEQDLGKELFAKLELDRGGFGFGRGGDRRGRGGPGRGFGGLGRSGPSTPLRPQGRSAFVFTDPATKTTRLFDFVNIAPRKSGYKVRLHKDRLLDGMRTMNVLYEPDERTFINEALAYDLYRAAGNATPRSGYLRLVMDGKLVGVHLWFEQINGAFLRHNEINDKGNLYKVTWQGSSGASVYTPEDKRPTKRLDVVRRYEKKSNPHDGYDDLIELVEALEEAEGDDRKMWEVIEERFDVENVINYFAANSLLSHWDGFFNNYYLYHDTKRDKWMMFPFDQDSTWSQRMGDVESLSRMPLNYGAADAERPGGGRGFGPGPRDRDEGRGGRPGGRSESGRPGGRDESPRGRPDFGPSRGRGGFGGRGFGWWRDGGEISAPLLANPEFRKRFLARLQELADTVFTEEDFGARIAKAEDLLKVEVVLRAKARGTDEKSAAGSLGEIMNSLRSHLAARRAFVLSQLQEAAEPKPAGEGS